MQQDRQKIYNDYMERFRLALIENYDKLGLRASGAFAESLEYTIKRNKLVMYGAKHAGAMEGGIRPSNHKYGPVGAIMKWIETKKGLPSIFVEKKKQFAFAIAKKIAKEGIRVPNEYNAGNVISDVVELYLGNLIFDLYEEIGTDYINDIDLTSDFKRILENVA